MFDINKVEIDWCGKKLILETGKIARQADASVIATYGGTTVMANVCAAKVAKPDIDSGRLVIPFSHYLESKKAFYLVFRESQSELGKIVSFIDWMLDLVAQEQN